MINLSILWHMHQPYYLNPEKQIFELPWVRMHSVKDYLDMLELVERYEGISVNFNFVPSLIKQIDMYVNHQIEDVFLVMTKKKADELKYQEKLFILYNFFMANWNNMIKPNKRYWSLLNKRGNIINNNNENEIVKKFSNQDFLDLQVLFNLVWIDKFHKNKYKEIEQIEKKGMNYTEKEKEVIIDIQYKIMKAIIPKIKELENKTKIEISTTPFYHCILPLICDTKIAKESSKDIKLPKNNYYHEEDARNQIQLAKKYIKDISDIEIKGMWPSEGAVSDKALELLLDADLRWTATDEAIIQNTMTYISKKRIEKSDIYKPWIYENKNREMLIFFRDHLLSDAIGFSYYNINEKDAVDDFIKKIKKIESDLGKKDSNIVFLSLDGENAWEYYKNDGNDFLNELYSRLEKEKDIKSITLSQYIDRYSGEKRIGKIYPGSWINSNFNIWIGHPEDNKYWEYLELARGIIKENKDRLDATTLSEVMEHIYIAEGSDWCWWYGDEHTSDSNVVFDELFRSNIIEIYKRLKIPIPEELLIPIKEKGEIKLIVTEMVSNPPVIDGKENGYFEWFGTGAYNCSRAGGTMHRSENIVNNINIGFDKQNIYFKVEINRNMTRGERQDILEINMYLLVEGDIKEKYIMRTGRSEKKDGIEYSFHNILEVAVGRKIKKSDMRIYIEVMLNGKPIERFPTGSPLALEFDERTEELIYWT